jgi:ABC-2 type transport system ATP-binding protein
VPAIEARALARSFGARRACWDISFTVERGEVFGLLGPNGAGKTTVLRLLSGLLAPDAGSATVAGFEVRPHETSPAALRGKVGLLTEHPGFYDRLTARENLVYAGGLQALTPADCAARARTLLDRFSLAPHADRPFAHLSRGMKQKLAIARALLHEPEVVLLDEPTVGLDPEATREVRTIVGELAAERRTIVLCTHHLDEVERLCGRAAFIAGRLLAVHSIGPLEAQSARVRVDLSEPLAGAAALLRAVPGVQEVREEGRALLVGLGPRSTLGLRAPGAPGEDSFAERVPELVSALVRAGARVCGVAPERAPLERAWVELLAQARAEGLVAADRRAPLDPETRAS